MLQSMPQANWQITINSMVATRGLTSDEGVVALEKAYALAKTPEPAVGTRAPSTRTAALEAKKAAAKTLSATAARVAAQIVPPAAAGKNHGCGRVPDVALSSDGRSRPRAAADYVRSREESLCI